MTPAARAEMIAKEILERQEAARKLTSAPPSGNLSQSIERRNLEADQAMAAVDLAAVVLEWIASSEGPTS